MENENDLSVAEVDASCELQAYASSGFAEVCNIGRFLTNASTLDRRSHSSRTPCPLCRSAASPSAT